MLIDFSWNFKTYSITLAQARRDIIRQPCARRSIEPDSTHASGLPRFEPAEVRIDSTSGINSSKFKRDYGDGDTSIPG